MKTSSVFFCLILVFFSCPSHPLAQVFDLSLEELLNTEVTTATRN